MDSHIDTADPWAAAIEDTEVSTSVAVETPLGAAVDEVETPPNDDTPGSVEGPAKNGLFGRRKAKAGQNDVNSEDGGFSLMSPAPVVLEDDPQFEVSDREALEVDPDLGLDDHIVDALGEDSQPLLAAPFEDELYPPLEAVEEEGGLGSISSVLNPSSFARSETIDFDSVSEEIANAVEGAQPAGIFGALSHPASMHAVQTEDSAESVEALVEKTEDSLGDIVTDTDESLETFVDSSHESLSGVLENSEHSDEEAIADLELPEASRDEITGVEDFVDKEVPSLVEGEDLEYPADGESQALDGPSDEVATDQQVDDALDEAVQENSSDNAADHVESLAIPADPFEVFNDSEEESADETASVAEPEQVADAIESVQEVVAESVDDPTEEVLSEDANPEEDPEMEPQPIDSSSESSFSLTNAPAEPLEGDEGLFVSAGTEEEVQPVVLVTTDTVPGMEIGDSCGLVTAVQAAADATVLADAIEKAHADLSSRASEVGATAVISVATAINEVKAGYLVVASGTAVLAAN